MKPNSRCDFNPCARGHLRRRAATDGSGERVIKVARQPLSRDLATVDGNRDLASANARRARAAHQTGLDDSLHLVDGIHCQADWLG